MPQLDFNIVFSQIFWLIIAFFFVYTTLIHFFLPNFIRLVKARKYMILINEKEILRLNNNFVKKQVKIKNITHKNFSSIKVMLEKQLNKFSTDYSSEHLTSIDTKIISILYHNATHCDTTIFNSIRLKLNFLNLKI